MSIRRAWWVIPWALETTSIFVALSIVCLACIIRVFHIGYEAVEQETLNFNCVFNMPNRVIGEKCGLWVHFPHKTQDLSC
jgi:hypothetical protein